MALNIAQRHEAIRRAVTPLPGREPQNNYKSINVPENCDGTTLLEARPLTGRTNQIRVRLWHLGFPVCGDAVYLAGKKIGVTQTLSVADLPPCLHAWRIKFVHPLSRQPVEFTAPPRLGGWSGRI